MEETFDTEQKQQILTETYGYSKHCSELKSSVNFRSSLKIEHKKIAASLKIEVTVLDLYVLESNCEIFIEICHCYMHLPKKGLMFQKLSNLPFSHLSFQQNSKQNCH